MTIEDRLENIQKTLMQIHNKITMLENMIKYPELVGMIVQGEQSDLTMSDEDRWAKREAAS